MIKNEYYNTADLVAMLNKAHPTVINWMFRGKILMCDNLEEVKQDQRIGFKWDKAKFDKWKLEVWDKQNKQK